MAAGMPTVTVEVAFVSDSLSTSPTWVDISSYVRAGSIKMGRSSEIDEYQAGSCSLTLDNRTRRFDPFYTAGPYYGNLKARRQCRISTTYNSVTYRMFYGFVSGWKLAPDMSGDSVCQIEGYDGLGYLAGIDLPVDYFTYYAEYLQGNFVMSSWWPLGSGDSQCIDKTGTYPWSFTSATPATGGVPSQWMQGSSTAFDGTVGAIGDIVPPADALSAYPDSWTVMGFVKTTEPGPYGYINPILCNAGPDNASIGIDSGGRLVFRNSSAGSANTGFPINDGNWHHFSMTYNGIGNPVDILVDGTYLTFDAAGSGDIGPGWQLLGLSNHVGDLPGFIGELAHIQTYQWPVDAFEAAKLYSAGMLGSIWGATTGDQMLNEVIEASNWPNLWQSIDDSTVKYGGVKWGQNALTVLQYLAATEGGRVFVDKTGKLTFYNRSHDLTSSRSITSQATYSDSGAAGVIPFQSVGEIAYSDAYLANKVTVTTANGTAFTVEDTTSQTTYGIVAKQIDTALASPTDAQTYASIYLDEYKDVSLRIQEWKVIPQAKGSVAFPLVLDARLTDRVTFEIMPNNVGTRISQQMLIEQISHDFTPETWTTTFSGSPAVAPWILEDATYGLLESTTILG